MSTGATDDLSLLIDEVVAPAASDTDRVGEFPVASVGALRKAGLLGLLSSTAVGGGGGTLADAAGVVEKLAGACGSTAMIVLMHYAGTAVIESHGEVELREEVAAGRHLTTLALSETGSRSHFWSPIGSATSDGDGAVRLDARKSWVTAAGYADSYVWSSRPLSASGPMTLWLVPSSATGLEIIGAYDGLGLRANASNPIAGRDVTVPVSARLGADGEGLDIALGTALPHFLVLNAAFSLGLMQDLVGQAAEILKNTRLEHLDRSLADQERHRARFADLLTRTDRTRTFLDDTLRALENGRDDATLRVLQVKAVAAEAASEVADGVMRLCGGSALRRELGLERRFRDGLAARVMAPTTDALHDFVGRAALGLPLF